MDIPTARAIAAREVTEGEETIIAAGWVMIALGVVTILAAVFVRSWSMAELEQVPSGRARAMAVKLSPDQLDAARGTINYTAVVGAVTGVGFVGLGFWAFSNPFPATACGLGAFVSSLVLLGMDDWHNLLSGWKLNLAILIILGAATIRAFTARSEKNRLDALRAIDRATRAAR